MAFLLDTHTFMWFLEDDKSLPSKSRNAIKDINNKCFLSIGCIWELAIKYSIGKLTTKTSFSEIGKLIVENDIELLSGKLVGELDVITSEFAESEATLDSLKVQEAELAGVLQGIGGQITRCQEDI